MSSCPLPPHARITSQKVSQRNNILKNLTGATWGCCKEVLLQTYKAIGRSVLNYGAPIWSPLLSNTQWQGLQARQNQALRTSTGCLLMTSIPHLHHEAEMMEVRPHNELLSVQFYLGAHLPERPDHHTTNRPPPKQRTIKETLWGKYRDDVEHLVFDGLNPVTYREALRSLHLTAVEEAISQYTPPLWPNNGHPDISEEERELPRETRTALAQLRSGYSRLLNSYLSRLDPDIKNICPDCSATPHDTIHLFNCRKKKVKVGVESLWTDPVQAAKELGLRV